MALEAQAVLIARGVASQRGRGAVQVDTADAGMTVVTAHTVRIVAVDAFDAARGPGGLLRVHHRVVKDPRTVGALEKISADVAARRCAVVTGKAQVFRVVGIGLARGVDIVTLDP